MNKPDKSQSISEQFAASDILDKLENYESLSNEYDRYVLLQENIEKHRQTTRSHIYKKVKDEYSEKCMELEKNRKKVEALLQNQLHTLLKEKKILNKFCQDKSDYLEEIDLRIRIGERQEDEFSEERNEIKENLLGFTEELARIEEFITKYSEVGLFDENQEFSSPPDQKEDPVEVKKNKVEEPKITAHDNEDDTNKDQKSAGAEEAEESHDKEINEEKEIKEEVREEEEGENKEEEEVEVKEEEEEEEEDVVEDDEEEGASPDSEPPANFLVVEEDSSPATEDCPVVQCPTSISADNSSETETSKKMDNLRKIPKGLLDDYVTGYLISLEGSRKNERFPLISSNITLGNSPGIDIRLRDPGIANFHARIQYKDRKHYLENLDTMGRCFVNGVQAKFIELKDSDVIRLGDIKLQVEYATPNKADTNDEKKKKR